MRQGTRKGLMTMAAATGVIAAASGYAHADAGAAGTAAGSPGVLSGNTVQVPVDVPVNVCGNTVDVVGLLNPSVGNACVQRGGGTPEGRHAGAPGAHVGTPGAYAGGRSEGASSTHGGAHAAGTAAGSPGVLSGNTVQVPVDVPVNVCGNSVNVVGLGNATADNACANGGHHVQPPETPARPDHPGTPAAPPAKGPGAPHGPSRAGHPRPQADAQLAHTGSGLPLGLTASAGAGALLAGAVLYRKARAAV
ncbi:chaplin [Streptomyces sp. TG1A-8]|uniref:chaplin n=1 Tax=Streptomyces sp. TG1A-8 TaxID=3051385 RepID=UPI00265C0B1F|nr:chaplin [Streptomyces sp. TG1A-8]MDO0928472.1 chaplin [Streptomyces sp. TG1A-8]